MGHVFISYRQNPDRHFASRLIGKIQEGGYETWQDTSGLSAGADWRQDIDQAIRDSFALVVVISPDSQKSEYVTYEWAFAIGVGIKVIPILLHSVEKMHPRLAPLQYLDFTEEREPWDKLIEVLAKANQEYQVHSIRPKTSTPHLVRNALSLLDHIDATQQRRGVELLAQTDVPEAHGYLRQALTHPNEYVRWWAAVFSAAGDSEIAIPLLAGSLKSPDAELRSHAVRRLINIGQAALNELANILYDHNHPHRSCAVYAIGETRLPEGTLLLTSMFPIADEDLRIQCFEAFAKLGQNHAVYHLEPALDDASPKVRAAALQALKKIAQFEIQCGAFDDVALKALGKYSATRD